MGKEINFTNTCVYVHARTHTALSRMSGKDAGRNLTFILKIVDALN